MIHPNYFPDVSHPQTVYRCCECPWDGSQERRAIEHAATHPVRAMLDESLDYRDWICLEKKKKLLAGVRITIGFLTWNTVKASVLGAESVLHEVLRLRDLGAKAIYSWVDNGSTDGTQAA